MKRNTTILLTILSAALLGMSACSKKLDLTPVSTVSDASFWKTPEQFDAFVAGIHTAFRANTLQFEMLGEVRADQLGTDPGNSGAFTGESVANYDFIWKNNLDQDRSGVPNFGNFYFNINQINLLIQQLHATSVVTAANKSYYLGIAHGMRAFYYFQLLRSWGAVIIQTEPTVSVDISNLAKGVSGEDSVMALVKNDIDTSVNNFGGDYSIKNAKGYWSEAATQMLKAEVYLWTSHRGGGEADATTALAALNDIQVNVPSLALLSDYASVFSSANKGNNEMILAIHNQLNESTQPFVSVFWPATASLANFYDSANNRKFNVTTDNWGGLLQVPVKIETFWKYSDQDTRKWANITAAYNLEGSEYLIAGCFLSKYQGEQNGGVRVFTNDYPIYRFADLLLLKAEAEVALGQDPANEINLVRARAFGNGYDPATLGYPNQSVDANPVEAILAERYFEFLGEGKRWYDLRRMGDSYVFEHTNIPSTNSYQLLWPIDRATLTNNTALQQTPGYPQF